MTAIKDKDAAWQPAMYTIASPQPCGQTDSNAKFVHDLDAQLALFVSSVMGKRDEYISHRSLEKANDGLPANSSGLVSISSRAVPSTA